MLHFLLSLHMGETVAVGWLAAAEESLTKKETKKAREDVRIATNKSQMSLDRLADLRRAEPNNEDARIFPMMYGPRPYFGKWQNDHSSDAICLSVGWQACGLR
jgi:hypothetical protein